MFFNKMAIDEIEGMREDCKKVYIYPGHLSIRKQRIEHWAYKGRSILINDKTTRSSCSLGTSFSQKRSQSSLFQADRRLNMDLFQLGEQREKLIERRNFDQKVFVHQQAIRHKDNQEILRTLSYVKKCCKYSHMNDNKKDLTLEENSLVKKNRSRSFTPIKTLSFNPRTQTSTTLTETFLRHNKKHIEKSARKSNENNTHLLIHSTETSFDDEAQKRHVQFRINSKRTSQSAHVLSRSRSLTDDKQPSQNVTLPLYHTRTTNSAPQITTIDHREEQIQLPPKLIKRSPSRILFSAKNSLQEFRLYPERFLSKSNRYLPLLRRQVASHKFYLKQQKEKTQLSSTSRLSVGSDLAYDDAKSFLSEDIDINSHIPVWDLHERRKSIKNDLKSTIIDDTSEYTIALSRHRDREYAHLHALISSNSIDPILQPFSSPKETTSGNQQQQHLRDILHSIDSLRYSTSPVNRQIDIEKNLSKLGILIF